MMRMVARGGAERRTGTEGRRRLDHVLAVAPNAILVVAHSGRCLYVNPAAARAIGIDAAAAEGRSLREAGLPPQLGAAIARAGATPTRGELRLPTPHGERRFEYLLTALGDDGSVVVSLRDLTEDAAASRPAPSAGAAPGNGATSSRVAAPQAPPLSPELAARLRQSCHDLRARLTVMLSWGQVIERSERTDAMVRQGAAAVVSAARRMSAMVDTLAEMAGAQDDAGAQSPAPWAAGSPPAAAATAERDFVDLPPDDDRAGCG